MDEHSGDLVLGEVVLEVALRRPIGLAAVAVGPASLAVAARLLGELVAGRRSG
jgi:hypothetical protein